MGVHYTYCDHFAIYIKSLCGTLLTNIKLNQLYLNLKKEHWKLITLIGHSISSLFVYTIIHAPGPTSWHLNQTIYSLKVHAFLCALNFSHVVLISRNAHFFFLDILKTCLRLMSLVLISRSQSWWKLIPQWSGHIAVYGSRVLFLFS